MEQQVRCLRSSVQQRFGCTLASGSVLFAALVSHSAWLLNRFQAVRGGLTGFQRIRGVAYHTCISQIAEVCQGRTPKVFEGVGKLEERWQLGALGRQEGQ